MSKATKCDRCGACYEYGGKVIRQGLWAEFDLCADCAEAFDAWMECQPVTDAPERVTETPELLHDTREKLEADVREEVGHYFAWQEKRDQFANKIVEWLDRQAAIDRKEFETILEGIQECMKNGSR